MSPSMTVRTPLLDRGPEVGNLSTMEIKSGYLLQHGLLFGVVGENARQTGEAVEVPRERPLG